MHRNSMKLMGEFSQKYVTSEHKKILDIGSRIVARQNRFGTYKQLFPGIDYIGADIESGDNVDVVVKDYELPFADGEFDVTISGQTMEHMDFPWIWIKEVARVTRKGGLICLIAPFIIHEHRFPRDTYRYLPDGMRALAKWAELEVLETKLDKGGPKETYLEDCILIAKK
jgi:SAM-dependent methyltransferase